ncbi:MAG: ATP phosphoribosyltransferase [Oscillospiraceae bacterium]|jgi:ATP phosphoribosyltransferase|nr:ATP phosphoribosyltransferase [Oscillospiraceae bacterium]
MLNIALPKGRLGLMAYEAFEKIGYACPEIKENNRKLIFVNEEKEVRFFLVKPSDVPIYVENGAADIGVAGKDVLIENASDVYELADMGFGKCRMVVAAPEDYIEKSGSILRVATKFPNTANGFYASKSRKIRIIKLNGSIELAPKVNLSDVIVDIVESGDTLKENGLKVIETVTDISARLVANKSSYQFKGGLIRNIAEKLAKVGLARGDGNC